MERCPGCQRHVDTNQQSRACPHPRLFGAAREAHERANPGTGLLPDGVPAAAAVQTGAQDE